MCTPTPTTLFSASMFLSWPWEFFHCSNRSEAAWSGVLYSLPLAPSCAPKLRIEL